MIFQDFVTKSIMKTDCLVERNPLKDVGRCLLSNEAPIYYGPQRCTFISLGRSSHEW